MIIKKKMNKIKYITKFKVLNDKKSKKIASIKKTSAIRFTIIALKQLLLPIF